jgi:hypothetical protein
VLAWTWLTNDDGHWAHARGAQVLAVITRTRSRDTHLSSLAQQVLMSPRDSRQARLKGSLRVFWSASLARGAGELVQNL